MAAPKTASRKQMPQTNDIADPALADAGVQRVDWADNEMPVLAKISWSLDPGMPKWLIWAGNDGAVMSIMITSDQVVIPLGAAES